MGQISKARQGVTSFYIPPNENKPDDFLFYKGTKALKRV